MQCSLLDGDKRNIKNEIKKGIARETLREKSTFEENSEWAFSMYPFKLLNESNSGFMRTNTRRVHFLFLE